jgi:AraC-like DNA-binding protein
MSGEIFTPKHKKMCLHIENITFSMLLPSYKAGKGNKSPWFYSFLHSHVSSEIFVCTDGSITLEIPNGEIVLKKGDVAIVPPGVQHHMKDLENGTTALTLSFLCNKKNAGEGFDLYKMLSPFVAEQKISVFRKCPEIVQSIEKILVEFSNNKLLSIMHMLELLLAILDYNSEKIEPDANSRLSDTKDEDISRMMKIDELVNGFFDQNITLEEASKYLYISTRQLDRIVRKRYGKSLRSVLVDKRIAAAGHMLENTDMSVDKIGRTVGFGSKMGFYREFSKAHGMTPAEYRNSKKQ